MLNLHDKIILIRGKPKTKERSRLRKDTFKPHISESLLRSGLVLAAPLHATPIPIVAPTLKTIPGGFDINDAKISLRIMAAAGDGVMGVPWVKGAAGIALEIVNTLDVSHTFL